MASHARDPVQTLLSHLNQPLRELLLLPEELLPLPEELLLLPVIPLSTAVAPLLTPLLPPLQAGVNL